MDASRKVEVIGEILDFCNHEYFSYRDLIDYAKNEKVEWFAMIIENQDFFSSLFLNCRLENIVNELQTIEMTLRQMG